MTEPLLQHPYLAHPLSHIQWIELHAEALLFWNEHIQINPEYVPNEAASDRFVKRLRKQHQKRGRAA